MMKELPVPVRPVDLLFGGRREAIAAKVCMFCRGDANKFEDELSRREYQISGACQKCQNEEFS